VHPDSTWPSAPVPDVPGDVWRWQLPSVHDASRVRMDLRARLAHPSLTSSSTEDAREGLLLAFEELASNALRHGGGAVEAVIVATADGWILSLSDEAVDRLPVPAVDRDPALGGMGLPMVAQLSVQHGYAVGDDRKHVWAQLTSGVAVPGAMPGPRSRLG
jgi:hypothetical protein